MRHRPEPQEISLQAIDRAVTLYYRNRPARWPAVHPAFLVRGESNG